MSDRRTPDAKLIEAVRILSRTIQTDDGVIPACLAEVATRLAELVEERQPVAWGRRSKATGKITFVTFEPPVCIWSHEDIVPLYERQPLPPVPEGDGNG